jgi:hypothetical protein
VVASGGRMRSRHVETKSTLILCPTVLDPGKYVCVDDLLLQLMDNFWTWAWVPRPGLPLASIQCTVWGMRQMRQSHMQPC